MGAQKKFKNMYPKEQSKPDASVDNIKNKQEIEAYIKKIEQMMQDPKMQKKAALILEKMIKGSPK